MQNFSVMYYQGCCFIDTGISATYKCAKCFLSRKISDWVIAQARALHVIKHIKIYEPVN